MQHSSDMRVIYRALVRFLLLVAAMLWVPVAVILDVVVIGHGMPEHGVTEISQELLLLFSVVTFGLLAIRRAQNRGFMILVSGFLLCMFIRELDFLFDGIRHGFWKYIVLGVITLTLLLALIWRQSVVPAMAAATRSVAFSYILTGLAIVLFFSRVFGTGTLWEMVLDDALYTPLIKNSVQEGTELLGYVLIGWGALQYYREQLRGQRGEEPAAEPGEQLHQPQPEAAADQHHQGGAGV